MHTYYRKFQKSIKLYINPPPRGGFNILEYILQVFLYMYFHIKVLFVGMF